MNIPFYSGREYPVVRTNASLEDLQLKASLLPEGPDLFRKTEEEIKEAFETGPAAYDMTHKPLDRQLEGRRLRQPLVPGMDYSPTEDEEIEAIVERATEDIWTHPQSKRIEVVGSKVIAATRQRENMAYANRWIFEVAKFVQVDVLVLPDVISINGLNAVVQGRYSSGSFEYSPPADAQKDPHGWLLMAKVGYDFESSTGTIIFE